MIFLSVGRAGLPPGFNKILSDGRHKGEDEDEGFLHGGDFFFFLSLLYLHSFGK